MILNENGRVLSLIDDLFVLFWYCIVCVICVVLRLCRFVRKEIPIIQVVLSVQPLILDMLSYVNLHKKGTIDWPTNTNNILYAVKELSLLTQRISYYPVCSVPWIPNLHNQQSTVKQQKTKDNWKSFICHGYTVRR